MNDHPTEVLDPYPDDVLTVAQYRAIAANWGDTTQLANALESAALRIETMEAERAVLLARAEHAEKELAQAESRLRDVYGCTDDTPCASCRGEALAGTAAPVPACMYCKGKGVLGSGGMAVPCVHCEATGTAAPAEPALEHCVRCGQYRTLNGPKDPPAEPERTDVASHPGMDAEALAQPGTVPAEEDGRA